VLRAETKDSGVLALVRLVSIHIHSVD
jgi:hypothetical protein